MLRTTRGEPIQGIQCIQNKKNGMNQKDHKKRKLQSKPGQHAQPPLGSASETASGMPWKYLQFKIGQRMHFMVCSKIWIILEYNTNSRNKCRTYSVISVREDSHFTEIIKRKNKSRCFVALQYINWYNRTEEKTDPTNAPIY